MSKIRVAVNGYGNIGKRVADAVFLQDDMILMGVTYNNFDYRIKTALSKGYNIYPVPRTQELVSNSDVVVDCTPKGVGAANKIKYMDTKSNIRMIFQGGEKSSVADVSFVSQVNYKDAVNRQSVRVVSCNTTGLCRALNPVRSYIKNVRAVLVRRATDPWESDKGGIINTVVPTQDYPSHQTEDVKTIIPEIDLYTTTCVAPVTISHLHYAYILLTEPFSNEICQKLFEEPRVISADVLGKMLTPNAVLEWAKDMGRPRGDVWEVVIFNINKISENEICLVYQVHNEAITIPETIDAIRAVTGLSNMKESMDKTNKSLKIISGSILWS